jgi:myo-inositol 2-dehydrogenase/D-chiro-inositol 1-dehydrogenase
MDRYIEAYVNEVRAFVNCLRTQSAPPVGGEDGRQAILIGLAARASFAANRPVRLDELATA